MTSLNIFHKELDKLLNFYRASHYSYMQTAQLLTYARKQKLKYEEPYYEGLIIHQPHFFKPTANGLYALKRNINEIVFVRLISALEVFLIDTIREIFIQNKEPFKRSDIKAEFYQSELLSFKSTTEIASKIITNECRRLSSGGLSEIFKYYKKYFHIELKGIHPGKNKMQEYHDRRHLLVHRLGRTDAGYRTIYNTDKQSITIDDSYLLDCIRDFFEFSEMVYNQVIFNVKEKFTPDLEKQKVIDRKLRLIIKSKRNKTLEFLEPGFEFWAYDEFSSFNNILDSKRENISGEHEIEISGSFSQIRSYLRIIRTKKRDGVISLKEFEIHTNSGVDSVNNPLKSYSTDILDTELLNKIKAILPEQPWPTGIHKTIANELNISNKLSSMGINYLIIKGFFKRQAGGKIIYD